MSLSRLVPLSLLFLGLSGCASSIRVGGGQSESGEWEYKVVHVTELARGEAPELYGIALGDRADPELASAVCNAIETGLNDLSEEGWVLLDTDQGVYVFRRPSQE